MKASKLKLDIVKDSEQNQQAFAIRTLVYIGEQNCPWHEEFDGNDYTATHVLGCVDGEPVATARIRWFGDFAKLERLAIRTEFRGIGYGHEVFAFLTDICKSKGYTQVYIHAAKRLQSFYEKYGFRRIGRPFSFSDHDYVEMVNSFDATRDRLTVECGPHVLNRPEGAWKEQGILEKSAMRSLPGLQIDHPWVPAFSPTPQTGKDA
jgi:predicted GNAT family N-acyltransferase